MNLRDLKPGRKALIKTVGGEGALRQHLLDMGVIPGVTLEVVKFAPLGDPMEVRIHGYELTLRLADAEKIEIELCEDNSICHQSCHDCPFTKDDHHGSKGKYHGHEHDSFKDDIHDTRSLEHPGLGEGGRFHAKEDGDPLPEGTILTFALVGNQNSGKTTLFNQLTGSNQHVGNFPGVTVDRKDGVIRNHKNTLVTDLPGIYSMSPYSSEELISRNFVINENPHAIINIIDATNIERNLYLTTQLLEMEKPMVVALNMMDEVNENGGAVDINLMERMLGVPVVPISAAKNQGVNELIEHAIHVAYYQEKPLDKDLCDKRDLNGAVHRTLHGVMHLIEDHARRKGLPVRFSASKLLEGDELIEKQLELDENEKNTLDHLIIQMEKESGLDRKAAMADIRFRFIDRLCHHAVTKPAETKEHARSRKIDSVLTGKYSAIPLFILIMATVFFLTFNVIGAWLQGLLEIGVNYLTARVDGLLVSMGTNEIVHGLIVEGIFAGVGSVISFVPIIVTLFFFLSIMEDSGYIARVAFFMDKMLRKIGLSGRSIVPMLIGFGCTVPAVMSTRTLPSERDRRMTILLTPFMSCSAKIPIYAFFVNAFFPDKGWLVMTGLYVLGIVTAILVALLLKNTFFHGEAVPFVMELPNYRMPSAKSVGQLLWSKAKDFLQRAFSVIMIASIVVWLLQSFDLSLNRVTPDHSIMAMIANLLVPLFKPVGLGDWRICTSLISGFMAKESVVSTMEMLFGGPEGVASALSVATVASMLVFSLLYTPCVAAIASIRRELGRRQSILVVIWQCCIAWIFSLITYLIVK